jgi:amidophosphoribosyltransferase
VALHRRAGKQSLLDQVYDDCQAELKRPAAERVNRVKAVYEAFTDEEISAEVSRMVYPEGIDWDGEVQVIFQNIENLHASIKGNCGDWYFTGNYPTPGGYAMVNQAYLRWYEGVGGRSYDLPL